MANGYKDDPTIDNVHPLWRRIPPGRWTFDHNLGRVRPNSDCFKYSPPDPETGRRDPMSVALGGEVPSVAAALGPHVDFKLVSFSAGRARELQLGAQRDPVPELDAHALVFANQGDEIPKRVRNQLAEEASWVTELTLGEIEEARKRTAR